MVEDEPAIAEVCRRVLTEEGYETDVAVNGRVAQDMLEAREYDLCLIDIRTPAMNGEELFQWLKEKHPRIAKRVIFTTGDVMAGGTRGFLQQTARPFLPKPFTPAEIRTIIKKTLGELADDRR